MRPLDGESLRADSTSNPRSAVLANVNRQAGEPAVGSRVLARQNQMFPNTGAVQSRAALVLNEPRADADHFTPGLEGSNL